MPRRRAAAALLFAIATTAQEARDFDFCGEYAMPSIWTIDFDRTPDGGQFEFAATDPITGAGCRALTTDANNVNAIWLTDDQEVEDEEEDGEEENSDYSVEVTGRPEETGEAGVWAVLLRAHGFEAGVVPPDPYYAYACTVNSFDCSLTLSAGLTSGLGFTPGEDRYDLASTEITDCADEAASPELWKLYAFAVGDELGCQVTLPSGARFSVDDKDGAYEIGAVGIAGAGAGHTFASVSIVAREDTWWPPTTAPTGPTLTPTGPSPTYKPTTPPSANPAPAPTPRPSPSPSAAPDEPTLQPVPSPTPRPSSQPTPRPTADPTLRPTPMPTFMPTPRPSPAPVPAPTPAPSPRPSEAPTRSPTRRPTPAPSATPGSPTAAPVFAPTPKPTPAPVPAPTSAPTTAAVREAALAAAAAAADSGSSGGGGTPQTASAGFIVLYVVAGVVFCGLIAMLVAWQRQKERKLTERKDSWDISTMFTDEANLPDAEEMIDVEPERVVLVDLVRREALEVEHQLQERQILGAREQVLDARVRGVAFAARGVEPLGRAAVLLQEALELPLDHAAVLEVARVPLQRVLRALGQRVELGAVRRRKVADRRREVGSAEEVLELLEQRERVGVGRHAAGSRCARP